MKNRARNPKLKGRFVNPLRLDPTRTTMLRKAAIADVRRRFARLALALDELIVRQDSFGLTRKRNGPPSPFAFNAFCATGEGGGVDPTCSPIESTAAGTDASGDHVDDFLERMESGELDSDAAIEIGNVITSKQLHKIVRTKNGKIIGGVSYKVVGDDAISIKHMGSMKPGVGREMMEHLQSKFSWINTDNTKSDALGFYRKLGFEIGASGDGVWKRPTANVFCPTGPGGGIDPTCGSEHSIGQDIGTDRSEYASDSGVAFPAAVGVKIPKLGKDEIYLVRYSTVDETKSGEGVGHFAYAGKHLDDVINATQSYAHGLGGGTTKGFLTIGRTTEPDWSHSLSEESSGVEHNGVLGKSESKIDKVIDLSKLPTANVFCPTGEGGGVDPSCGRGESKFEMPSTGTTKGDVSLPLYRFVGGSQLDKRDSTYGMHWTHSREDVEKMANDEPGFILTADHPGYDHVMDWENEKDRPLMEREIGAYEYRDKVYGEVPIRPRTKLSFRKIEKIDEEFKWSDVTKDVVTTNERWELKTSPEQLAAFQEWLKRQLKWYVIGMTQDQLWSRYVQEGFRKGAGRAFDDVRSKRGAGFRPDDFLQGQRQQFMSTSFRRPETVEKVKLLASRTFEEMVNVGEEIKLKLGRSLLDGLVQGKNPREIARDMRDKLAIPMRRAEAIARTEIIRAHAEGQLNAMEDLGVDEVGVMVEFSTAGDDRVCPSCSALEGVVLKLSEAHGMIPRHVNCRCSFLPANVGESRKEQVRGKAKIERQIDISARLAGDTFDVGIEIDAYRPRSLITPTKNAFCPTGEGGGVDPTCGSTDVSGGMSHFEAMDKSAESLASMWNVSDHVVERLNKEDGVKPDAGSSAKKAFAYSAIRAWQGSSGGPVATEIVRGAMEHAGLDSSGIHKSEGSDKWFASHPEERDALHSLGKAMYDSTQKWLADRGISEIEVYRKGSTDRPFSSWTTKPGWVRQGTHGEVVKRTIPARHVLSIPATGFGSRNEHEVVVLGGHGK